MTPEYDHSEYLRKQQAARVESALAGLKGAYSRSMAGYDAALELLPQRYQGYRNDAAAQSAMAQKNFDERAQASGLNSGASGQAALDASAVYRGTLAQLNQAQANAAAELDRGKADLTAQYETAVAQARANGDADLAQALYQELIRVDEWTRQNEQSALAQQNWQSQFDFTADQEAYRREQDALARQDAEEERARQDALNAAALKAEVLGDFSGYAELWGLDEETVVALAAAYATQKGITEAQAARDLADWYAAYGDFSKVEALGVKPQLMRSSGGRSGGSSGSKGNRSSGSPTSPSVDTVETTRRFTSYDSAVQYLRQQGIDPGTPYTNSEWSTRRSSYKRTGHGDPVLAAYDTYADYITAYVQYCLETKGR